MTRSIKYLFLISFIGIVLSGQSVDQLRKKKNKINDELQLTSSLLEEVATEKKNFLHELAILNKQLKSRQDLLDNYSAELLLVEKNMETIQSDIVLLEDDLGDLKDDYGTMIRQAYKTKSSQNWMLFLLASDDFNDALRRLKYIRYYNDFRLQQVDLILSKKAELDGKIEEIEQERVSKNSTLQEQKDERDRLAYDIDRKNKVVAKLKNRESDLKKQLRKKRNTIEQLEGEIEGIIRAEIQKKKLPSTTKVTSNTPKVNAKTPEAKKLSSNFKSNKGKLPWPVAKGVVTRGFGLQRHPDLAIDINNSGIDISVPRGIEARCVFDGEVSQIIYSPSFLNAVIVNHGDYFTVYSNLSIVYVKKGEKLSTKQRIGLPSTDGQSGQTELHFEVWKETTKMNPKKWITR